ncbi:MAG: hypothetical protein ACJAWL_000043 [Motiliproteus sp.]|jgi:hypothetical protein
MLFFKALGSRRLIIIGMLVSIAMVLPKMHLASINPVASLEASIERHAVLESQALGHSQHIHENGTFEEANLDHQHGHNAGDHNHYSADTSSEKPTIDLNNSIWLSDYNRTHLSTIPILWLRPPRFIQAS